MNSIKGDNIMKSKLSGAYTVAISGDYYIFIGDGGKVCETIHSSEIVNFLIEQQCADIYEDTGLHKVLFRHEQIHN